MTDLSRRPAIFLFCVLSVSLFGMSACSRRRDSGPAAASDGDPKVSSAGRQNRSRRLEAHLQELLKRSRTAEVVSRGHPDQLFDETISALGQDGLTNLGIDTAVMTAHSLYYNDVARVAAALRRIATAIRQREEGRFAGKATRLEGVARRLLLPGKVFEVTGTTLDGQPFDWKTYRGKVVLIDYWETQCAPCFDELKNIKANYDRFHKHGFEVVSISIDTDRDRIRKSLRKFAIPGTILFDSRGYGQPMAVRYGIATVPTVFLVGRDGKVVSRSARGADLGRLLAQLFSDR